MGNGKEREVTMSHFARRAHGYNRSSRWVDDVRLIELMRELARVDGSSCVLDVAIGTGKVAGALRGRVRYVVGVDICREMVSQAIGCADGIVLTAAENMPFKEGVFDACVCRQGMQFMDAEAVCAQMYRVLKPGGRVVLCHLTAYGEEDREESFLIQKLRNPARRNFFMPGDVPRMLTGAGFTALESFEYLTRESVAGWTGNAAIDGGAVWEIRRVYENASEAFKRIHAVEFRDGDIFDTMKMLIVRAEKKGV